MAWHLVEVTKNFETYVDKDIVKHRPAVRKAIFVDDITGQMKEINVIEI